MYNESSLPRKLANNDFYLNRKEILFTLNGFLYKYFDLIQETAGKTFVVIKFNVISRMKLFATSTTYLDAAVMDLKISNPLMQKKVIHFC